MKKISVLLITMILLTGCGKQETVSKQWNVDQIANQLYTEIAYEDTLTKVDDAMLEILYEINPDDVKQQMVYCSGAVTAEEIAVFEMNSEDAAKEAEKKLEQRVKDQIEGFQDYLPKEVVKLDKAIIKRQGNMVVLSISNDSEQAKKILNQ